MFHRKNSPQNVCLIVPNIYRKEVSWVITGITAWGLSAGSDISFPILFSFFKKNMIYKIKWLSTQKPILSRLAEQPLAKFLLWEFNPTPCAVPDKERKNPLSFIPTLITKKQTNNPQPLRQKKRTLSLAWWSGKSLRLNRRSNESSLS